MANVLRQAVRGVVDIEETANDVGRQAKRLLSQVTFDVAVLDISLPIMAGATVLAGLDLMEEISRRPTVTIPVI